MKNLLLGSVALSLFSCSILIFQISCSKDAQAQITSNGANKIVYYLAQTGPDQNQKLWMADDDGANASEIPINLPGWALREPHLSPDGSKIFFSATDSTTFPTGMYASEIFSVNIDGSNLQRITQYNSQGKSAWLTDIK